VKYSSFLKSDKKQKNYYQVQIPNLAKTLTTMIIKLKKTKSLKQKHSP